MIFFILLIPKAKMLLFLIKITKPTFEEDFVFLKFIDQGKSNIKSPKFNHIGLSHPQKRFFSSLQKKIKSLL